jgi:hypothetical protein
MKDLLSAKFPEFLFTSIPIISQSTPSETLGSNEDNEKFVIVFSGSVNVDRLETLQVLANIIKKKKNVTLKYLTSQSELELRKLGVFYDNFELDYCANEEDLMSELNAADLLYFPISFSFPETKKQQMMTCFGAKVYDYMVSTTPILVLAPSSFFHYVFFEKDSAAFLIDTLDEIEIRNELSSILLDAKSEVEEKFVKRSTDLSQQFKGEVIADLFSNTIEMPQY